MSEYNTGFGTTPDMWEMLSEILAERGERLPESLNTAIYALRDGTAKVVSDKLVIENAALESAKEKVRTALDGKDGQPVALKNIPFTEDEKSAFSAWFWDHAS